MYVTRSVKGSTTNRSFLVYNDDSSTTDAYEATERHQPKPETCSASLSPDEKRGISRPQKSLYDNDKQQQLDKMKATISKQDLSQGQQGMADRNEHVESPDTVEINDDRWGKIQAGIKEATPCSKESPSNTAPGIPEDQSSFVESPSEQFLDDLFQECKERISSSPSSSFISHAGENTQSSSSSPRNILTPSTSSTSNLGGRRKRADENDDENSGENRGYKKPRLDPTGGPQRGIITGRQLACPLHIFNPEKYCKNGNTGSKYITCSNSGIVHWHRLK